MSQRTGPVGWIAVLRYDVTERHSDLGEGVRQMIWLGLYLIGTIGAGGPMMIRGAERTLNMMQPERLATFCQLVNQQLNVNGRF